MDYTKLLIQVDDAISKKDFERVMNIAHRILDGYEKKEDGFKLVNVFADFERFYLNIPNSIMYITYMRRLKKLYENEGKYKELVDTMYLIINDYIGINDIDTAYILCTDAMKIAKEHNYLIGECNLLNAFGNTCDALGKYEEAIEYYDNAYLLSISINHQPGTRFTHNIGLMYKKLKNFKEAEKYFKIAYDYNKSLKKVGAYANTCNEYGDVLTSLGDYLNALKYLEEGYDLCIESNSNSILKENYLFQSRYYETLGKPTIALDFYKSYHQLDQIISRSQQESEFKQLIFETQLKHTQIETEAVKSKNKELEAFSQELRDKNIELHKLLNELQEYKESINTLEKQSAFNRMLMGISHHINTSLGNSLLSISYLQDAVEHLETSLNRNALSKAALEKFLSDAKFSLKMMMKSYDSVNSFIDRIKETPISMDELKKSNPLTQIIEKCMLKHQDEIMKSNISFITKLEDPIPKIKGTKVFEEICNQLLSNALKYAFKEKNENTITITANLDQSNNLNIEFIDNGHGIEQDKVEKIFDPFYTSEMGLEGGAGLGLYFVSKTVYDVLGGSIKCVSAYGEGTQFIIKLPNNGISFTKLSH